MVALGTIKYTGGGIDKLIRLAGNHRSDRLFSLLCNKRDSRHVFFVFIECIGKFYDLDIGILSPGCSIL